MSQIQTPKNPEIRVSTEKIESEDPGTRISLLMINPENNTDIIGKYSGNIFEANPTLLEQGQLAVEPHFRGKGYGEQMVRKLVDEARAHGVEVFRGTIESEYALDIRARVFGETAMRFFEEEPDSTFLKPVEYVELPMSFEQARDSLVRARDYEDTLEDRFHGIIVEQPLKSLLPAKR